MSARPFFLKAHSDLLVLVLTLLLLCAPLAAAAYFVYNKHQWAQQKLEELEPRHARLLGLQAQKQGLDQQLGQARGRLAQLAYPAEQDINQAGNDAQQRVRDVFTGAGLEVVSSQVLPPVTEKPFDRIPLTVRLEGELLGLQSALAVLSGLQPAVLVEGLSVQTIGLVKADTPQRLAIQFNLSALRVQP